MKFDIFHSPTCKKLCDIVLIIRYMEAAITKTDLVSKTRVFIIGYRVHE